MKNENNPEVIDVAAETGEVVCAASECEVDGIIRNRVYASVAVGLAPIPLLDLGALTAIQMEMIYRLGKVYNVPFKKEWGRKAITFILGSLAPVMFAPGVGSLLRYVPLVGPGLGAAGGSVTFGAATYAVGRAFARRFAKGQAISEADFESLGEEVKSGFDKGKKKVKEWMGSGASDKGISAEPTPA